MMCQNESLWLKYVNTLKHSLQLIYKSFQGQYHFKRDELTLTLDRRNSFYQSRILYVFV